MKKKSNESIIARAMGKLLRDNFGKGPESIHVSLSEHFITIYLQHFLAPMEKILMKKNNEIKVQETRDLLMQELIPEIRLIVSNELSIKDMAVYYDWNLKKSTGMIFIEKQTTLDSSAEISDYPGKEKMHEEIANVTKFAQKLPEQVNSFLLNDRTLIVYRETILVEIEKELIRNGFQEPLRLSKRKLEKNLINAGNVEQIMNRDIQDCFVDWNFEKDTGFFVFVFKK